MTGEVPAVPRPVLLRLTPQLAVLLLISAIAWALTVYEARSMGNGPGTMGLDLGAFLGTWGLMMAAMMLPSVAPLAVFYSRAVRSHRAWRLAGFSAGYLVVWTLTGIPAYALFTLSGALARQDPAAGRIAAAVVLVVAGLWQLSSAKDYCLVRCRSPIGLLVRYGSYRGPLRDLRAAVHHAIYCLGCCWALMALLVVFGMMNLVAMTAIAAVVLVEKLAGGGHGVARLVGLGCLVMAGVVLAVPGLAPGLHLAPMPMHMS